MTHEMIERVARVLSPQAWQTLGTSCDTKARKKRREASLDYARRCVLAMREPTEDMIEEVEFNAPSGEIIGRCEAKNVWQEMIDKVLE